MTIEVIYNSDSYYVVSYPEQEGFEIVDKDAGLGGYLDGVVGQQFFALLEACVTLRPQAESIDSFLARYSWAMLTVQTYH